MSQNYSLYLKPASCLMVAHGEQIDAVRELSKQYH